MSFCDGLVLLRWRKFRRARTEAATTRAAIRARAPTFASRTGFQECVSEFISFITSEASDKCQREKRKTINGDDLLWAMATLGFEDYIDPLKIYLARYREMEGDTKGSAKGGESSAKKDVQPSPNAQVMICGFVCA
ncbi:hypothetical protein ACB092_09G019600 [Castanea dentata]